MILMTRMKIWMMISRILKTSQQYIIVKRLSLILPYAVIPSLSFCYFANHNIENYLNWSFFFFSQIALGIVVGIISNRVLCYYLPEAITFKNSQGRGIGLPLFTTILFLTSGISAILNEAFPQARECNNYIIEELSIPSQISKKRDKNFIWITGPNGRERLQFGRQFNLKHRKGDSVSLCIITGLFGFKYFQTF